MTTNYLTSAKHLSSKNYLVEIIVIIDNYDILSNRMS